MTHIGIIFIFLLMHEGNSFYIPGVAPVEFRPGDKIEVKAVKMTSSKTQLPYEYYSLPFCRPKNGTVYASENMGEILRGDRIVNTPYEVYMSTDVTCKLLCQSPGLPLRWSTQEKNEVTLRILKEYYVHLIVDNLPCSTKRSTDDNPDVYVEPGYPLGFTKNGEVYINNHLDIILFFHKHGETNRVVGFEVDPKSVSFEQVTFTGNQPCTIPTANVKPQKSLESKIYFTYSVTWKESNIKWASRWDIYLAMKDVEIHWFAIINSTIAMLFLAGVMALILIKTLRRDIAKYNSEDYVEDMIEQFGWKLVHGDVFRPPKHQMLFISIVGSGVQIFFMSLVTIVFAMLGMLSPASRGELMSCAIFFYAGFGGIAGYVSGRIYKTIKGRKWLPAALAIATFYPGIVFGSGFILNMFIWNKESSGAVPFTTMCSLLLIWFGFSLPLVVIGYHFGYRSAPIPSPVRTNQIPRQIPEQPWHSGIVPNMLVGGILPFGAIYIELYFIFSAIWQNQFYYLFGVVFMVFLILVITCALMSVIMTYFQLCNEDYNWWWKSMFITGGSVIYVILYSIYYFQTKLEITEFVPTLLYFGYSAVMAFTYWLLTATIGFLSTYWFVRKIYSEIKID